MARTLVPLLLAAMAVVCVVGIWRLFLALRRRRRQPRQREDVLQYEVWYALRQQDAAAAERFLAGLWDRMAAERSRPPGRASGGPGAAAQSLLESQVAEMAGAVEALGRAHAGEPALPPALAVLEERVKRLCSDLAAVQPGGTP